MTDEPNKKNYGKGQKKDNKTPLFNLLTQFAEVVMKGEKKDPRYMGQDVDTGVLYAFVNNRYIQVRTRFGVRQIPTGNGETRTVTTNFIEFCIGDTGKWETFEPDEIATRLEWLKAQATDVLNKLNPT